MPLVLPRVESRFQKPPLGALLDRGNNLAQGLVACLNFAERAGTPRDQFGCPLTWQATGAPWGIGPYGPAVGPFTASQRLNATQFQWPSTNVTVLMLIKAANDGSAHSAFGNISPSPGAPDLQAHFPYSDGVIYWDCGGNSGSHRLTWTPPTAFWGAWHAIALTGGVHGPSIWSDGVRVAVSATATGSFSGFNGLMIGKWTDPGSQFPLQGLIALFAIYNRDIGVGAIEQWSTNPYAMFLPTQPERRWLVFGHASSFPPVPEGVPAQLEHMMILRM